MQVNGADKVWKHMNRQFKAERPNQLWVSDFTYVSTWQGWQYVAFVIDVYARRIEGCRRSSSMRWSRICRTDSPDSQLPSSTTATGVAIRFQQV